MSQSGADQVFGDGGGRVKALRDRKVVRCALEI